MMAPVDAVGCGSSALDQRLWFLARELADVNVVRRGRALKKIEKLLLRSSHYSLSFVRHSSCPSSFPSGVLVSRAAVSAKSEKPNKHRKATTRDTLSLQQFQKIWLVLFYAAWLSDTPLVQRELFVRLALLQRLLHAPEEKRRFFKAFFFIMQSQWHALDQHRLDKFLLLIRIVTAELTALLLAGCYSSCLYTSKNCALNGSSESSSSTSSCSSRDVNSSNDENRSNAFQHESASCGDWQAQHPTVLVEAVEKREMRRKFLLPMVRFLAKEVLAAEKQKARGLAVQYVDCFLSELRASLSQSCRTHSATATLGGLQQQQQKEQRQSRKSGAECADLVGKNISKNSPAADSCCCIKDCISPTFLFRYLLLPFFYAACYCSDRFLLQAIHTRIFRAFSFGDIDFEQLAGALFSLASCSDVRAGNRRMLYACLDVVEKMREQQQHQAKASQHQQILPRTKGLGRSGGCIAAGATTAESAANVALLQKAASEAAVKRLVAAVILLRSKHSIARCLPPPAAAADGAVRLGRAAKVSFLCGKSTKQAPVQSQLPKLEQNVQVDDAPNFPTRKKRKEVGGAVADYYSLVSSHKEPTTTAPASLLAVCDSEVVKSAEESLAISNSGDAEKKTQRPRKRLLCGSTASDNMILPTFFGGETEPTTPASKTRGAAGETTDGSEQTESAHWGETGRERDCSLSVDSTGNRQAAALVRLVAEGAAASAAERSSDGARAVLRRVEKEGGQPPVEKMGVKGLKSRGDEAAVVAGGLCSQKEPRQLPPVLPSAGFWNIVGNFSRSENKAAVLQRQSDTAAIAARFSPFSAAIDDVEREKVGTTPVSLPVKLRRKQQRKQQRGESSRNCLVEGSASAEEGTTHHQTQQREQPQEVRQLLVAPQQRTTAGGERLLCIEDELVMNKRLSDFPVKKRSGGAPEAPGTVVDASVEETGGSGSSSSECSNRVAVVEPARNSKTGKQSVLTSPAGSRRRKVCFDLKRNRIAAFNRLQPPSAVSPTAATSQNALEKCGAAELGSEHLQRKGVRSGRRCVVEFGQQLNGVRGGLAACSGGEVDCKEVVPSGVFSAEANKSTEGGPKLASVTLPLCAEREEKSAAPASAASTAVAAADCLAPEAAGENSTTGLKKERKTAPAATLKSILKKHPPKSANWKAATEASCTAPSAAVVAAPFPPSPLCFDNNSTISSGGSSDNSSSSSSNSRKELRLKLARHRGPRSASSTALPLPDGRLHSDSKPLVGMLSESQ